jgi:hypothetical protein
MQFQTLVLAIFAASAAALPIDASREQMPSFLSNLFGGGSKPAASSGGGLGGLASLFGGGGSGGGASALGGLGSLFSGGGSAASQNAAGGAFGSLLSGMLIGYSEYFKLIKLGGLGASLAGQLGLKPSDLQQFGALLA